MGTLHVAADRRVNASPDVVYQCLADMQHHPNFLPPAFSGFQVESGGVGAGTVLRYTFTAGGRSRQLRTVIAEPEPGRVMTESDTNSSMVTTFTVTPEESVSRVRIESTWDGAGGVGGFFEKVFAPRVLRGVYADELERLDVYAQQQAHAGG